MSAPSKFDGVSNPGLPSSLPVFHRVASGAMVAGELLDFPSESIIAPAVGDCSSLGFFAERLGLPVAGQLPSDLGFPILGRLVIAVTAIRLASRRIPALARFGGGGIKGG
ncbi:hypothetical protein, partial [Blastomonas sp. CCH2-A2]|uniref:hypothetical protein n=1 Tax=Blastomonas sp. CCH2-A2 TaxID=1768788 RepID=UPI0012E332CA